MKKRLMALALIALIFTAIAGKGTLAATTSTEPVDAAAGLLEQAARNAGKDMIAFSGLYRNTDRDVITSDFQTDWSALASGRFDQAAHLLAYQNGDTAIVSMNYYTVSGRHPDSHMKNLSYLIPLTFRDGIWKMEFNQAIGDMHTAMFQKVLPEGFLEANAAPRNAIMMNTANLMFLDPQLVYQGHSQVELKLAWQQADGSVRLGIWLANGSGQNILYSTLKVLLTDDKLGTILDLRDYDLDIGLSAGTSRLIYVDVPANSVQTWTRSWTRVSSDVKVSFR